MEEKITAWLARDRDGCLTLFTGKPKKKTILRKLFLMRVNGLSYPMKCLLI